MPGAVDKLKIDAAAARPASGPLSAARKEAEEASAKIDAARERLVKQSPAKPDVPPFTAADDEPAPLCNVPTCLKVMFMSNLLTPLDTQAPTPLLPLLLTVDLEMPIVVVGRVFATLTCAALISFGLLLPLSKCMSPRSILLFDFGLRFVSGITYTLAVWQPGGTESTIYLVYLSRFLYGLTLNSFALPAAWIGVRLPTADRPAKIAAMQAFLALGIVFGPVRQTMAHIDIDLQPVQSLHIHLKPAH